MTSRGLPDPVVLAIAVDDPALADRLAVLLSDVPGLRLAGPGQAPDAVIAAFAAVEPSWDAALTPRELEVVALMAQGISNKAIADRLGISSHTAKFHVGSVLDKLDATGRTDAVAQAARLGVIHL